MDQDKLKDIPVVELVVVQDTLRDVLRAELVPAFTSMYQQGRIAALREVMRFSDGDAADKIMQMVKREEATWIPLTKL